MGPSFKLKTLEDLLCFSVHHPLEDLTKNKRKKKKLLGLIHLYVGIFKNVAFSMRFRHLSTHKQIFTKTGNFGKEKQKKKTSSKVKILKVCYIVCVFTIKPESWGCLFLFLTFVWDVCKASLSHEQQQTEGRHSQNSASFNLSTSSFYMCPKKRTFTLPLSWRKLRRRLPLLTLYSSEIIRGLALCHHRCRSFSSHVPFPLFFRLLIGRYVLTFAGYIATTCFGIGLASSDMLLDT